MKLSDSNEYQELKESMKRLKEMCDMVPEWLLVLAFAVLIAGCFIHFNDIQWLGVNYAEAAKN